MRRLAFVGLVLLAPFASLVVIALTPGCRTGECTQMGAETGVGLEIRNAFPDSLPYEVRACAGGECVDWRGDRTEAYGLWVPLDVSAPTTVTVTLTLASPTDPTQLVYNGSTSVDLAIVQPNGPRCPPTAYQGSVRVTQNGDLVPVTATS